jgi:hypothetical protein
LRQPLLLLQARPVLLATRAHHCQRQQGQPRPLGQPRALQLLQHPPQQEQAQQVLAGGAGWVA